MLQIPVTTTGNEDYDITLEGTTYTFQFRYNGRNERIYMNILKDGDYVASGVRLLEYSQPFNGYVSDDLPPGWFYIAKLTSTDNSVTLGNIGIDNEYSLAYVPSTDITF